MDEIHRMPKTVEEYLYSAMEDFKIDIMIDQGANARSVRLNIPVSHWSARPPVGLLTAPLRTRFTLQARLDYYSVEDMVNIIRELAASSAWKWMAWVPRRSQAGLGARRGSPTTWSTFPGIFAQQRGEGKITGEMASAALELLEIDSQGLDEMDKKDPPPHG